MKKKIIITTSVALALLLSSTTAFARGGHDNDGDNEDGGRHDVHQLSDLDGVYVVLLLPSCMAIVDGLSKPGDYIELRAEMEVLVALSNCPQMNNPANDYHPTPIRVVVSNPEPAA